MIKAFYVNNKKGSSLNLWRTASKEFQIIKNGRFLDLLIGSDYILIHKKYLTIFESISSKLVKKQFSINELSLFGKNEKVVWYFPTQYQLRLLVSEKIKLELENVSAEKFIFSDDEKELVK